MGSIRSCMDRQQAKGHSCECPFCFAGDLILASENNREGSLCEHLLRTQFLDLTRANKQIFAKQGYQKFVREDALPYKLPTRKDKAYNASPIKIRKRISSGRALSVRIIKNKKTGMKPVFLFLVTRTGIEPMFQP